MFELAHGKNDHVQVCLYYNAITCTASLLPLMCLLYLRAALASCSGSCCEGKMLLLPLSVLTNWHSTGCSCDHVSGAAATAAGAAAVRTCVRYMSAQERSCLHA